MSDAISLIAKDAGMVPYSVESRRRKLTAFSLALFFMVFGLFIWRKLTPQLQAPGIYERDFIQLYVMGKAATNHTPLYQPIPDLASQYDLSLAGFYWYPSAYPPAFAFLGMPLSIFDYKQSFVVWVCVEIGCFALALIILLRIFRDHTFEILILGSVFVLWHPFNVDLYHGQVMTFALLCLTSSWWLIRSGRDFIGGLPLAVLLSLKLYAWPILLFLLIARKWTAFCSALAGFMLMNLWALWWFGPEQFVIYIQKIAPLMAEGYRNHTLNFSVLSLFGLAAFIAALVVTLGLALWKQERARDFDAGYMIALVASAVLSPVAWSHYFVTFLPALCLLVSRNARTLFRLTPIAILAWIAVPEYTRLLPLLFVAAFVCWLCFLPQYQQGLDALQAVRKDLR